MRNTSRRRNGRLPRHEVPLTPLAIEAFRRQMAIAGDSPFLFPSDLNQTGHQTTFKTVWHKTLQRAKVSCFRIYDLVNQLARSRPKIMIRSGHEVEECFRINSASHVGA